MWNTEIPVDDCSVSLIEDDPEVHKRFVGVIHAEQTLSDCLSRFSSWSKLVRVVAICLRFTNVVQDRIRKRAANEIAVTTSLQMDDVHTAETPLIRLAQSESFVEEIIILSLSDSDDRERRAAIKASSTLYRLNPYLDDNGLVRVGGRLGRSLDPDRIKHPVVVPKKHWMARLIIRHSHEKIAHQGRGATINKIRSLRYWIIGCVSAVAQYIYKCVNCRKMYGKTNIQNMADLPVDRLEPSPPITYCGVDLFGPWYIKDGRKELKRYGVIFTCMASRAMHIETANSLSTDSFINALRRFMAIR